MRSSIVLSFVIAIIISGACNTKRNSKSGSSKYFEKANAFHYYEKLDSAFYFYNEYVNNADDSFRKATAYRYMGDISWAMGDIPSAEENATGAIQILDSSNIEHYTELCYVYHLLGNIRFELKQYDDAISMFDKAKRFATDSAIVFEILNNKALSFQKKGNYENAIAVFDSMLLLKPVDSAVFARILHNRTRTKWLMNKNYPALPEFWHVLKLRTDSQYTRGLNASYAHLSDYYEKINPDSALWYANKMLQQAQIIQNPADRIEALDKIIRLSDNPSLKTWYIEFKRIYDSLQLSRDSTQKIYALIRYDSKRSKEYSLELKERVATQWVWMCGLGLFAIAIIAWLWNRYNKRRKRIKLEAEQAIQQSKLKTSQKVHDVVANGLYRIMNELEHGKTIERDPLLDKIEILYEKSRDISYDKYLPQAEPSDYSKHLHDLLMAFNNDQTHVVITGNDQAFWSRMTARQKNELQLILTEIMVNMKKHSQANNVALAFSQDQHTAFISYRDDGKGFTAGQSFGNGLNNTVNRIKSLNGDVTFGESGESGVRMYISWPLQPTTT